MRLSWQPSFFFLVLEVRMQGVSVVHLWGRICSSDILEHAFLTRGSLLGPEFMKPLSVFSIFPILYGQERGSYMCWVS